jgi:hypothetical protein
MIQDALEFAFLNPAREATLTGEAQMGDHAAFLELARHYQRPLYRILRAAGSAETDTAALVEETLVRAWRDMPRYPGGRRFFPWLVAVARPFLPERVVSGGTPDTGAAPHPAGTTGAAFHLTPDEILATLVGRGAGIAESSATWDHLVECEECSSRLAALAMQEDTVPVALTTGPEDAVLGRIVEAVERRIRPVPGAAPDTNLEPALDTRVKNGSPPWGTLIIIGTLLASVGAVHVGMEYVPRWLGGPVGHGDTVAATDDDDSSGDATTPPAASDDGSPDQVAASGGNDGATGDDASVPSDDAPVAALPPVTVTPSDAQAVPAAKAPAAPAAKAPAAAPAVAQASAPAPAATRPAPAAPAVAPAPSPAATPAPTSGPAGTPAPSPARAPAATALPVGPIAIPGTVRPSAIGPDGSAVTPAAGIDTFASVGRPALGEVSTALQRDEEASLHPSIYAYEASADAWEQTLPLLHGNAYLEARLHLASARYRAWTLGRDSDRATRAASAIRSYLVGAPPGPDRGRATRWLADIIGK